VTLKTRLNLRRFQCRLQMRRNDGIRVCRCPAAIALVMQRYPEAFVNRLESAAVSRKVWPLSALVTLELRQATLLASPLAISGSVSDITRLRPWRFAA
jgi:hypothetical protein